MTANSDSAVRLRPARPADAAAIRDIYAPFVRETPVTFRTEVPSVEHVADEIREKREADVYPWYVAVDDDSSVLGYAYGSQLRGRSAYRWVVETSIYVDPDAHRGGIGTTLYDCLLDTLRQQNFCGAYAALAMPNPESVAFHERHDFERIGAFPSAGFKLGEWHDVVWYHKRLRDPDGAPAEPQPASVVDPVFADFEADG